MFCSRKPLYQLVTNGMPRAARGEIGAPGRGAAERVNDVAFALARDADERGGAAQHHDRIVAGEVEGYEFAAGRRHVGDQPSGARRHDGAVAGRGEDAHQSERAGIGRAAIEGGHRDEHGDRIARLLRARLGVGTGFGRSPRATTEGRSLTAGISGAGKLDITVYHLEANHRQTSRASSDV